MIGSYSVIFPISLTPMVDREELQARMHRFTEVCRDKRVKMTYQRMEIFREVASRDDHPDAEAIYKRVRERIPTVSLDTIYRNLWLFNNLGLITTLGLPHEHVKFDANIGSHHHFVCRRCGLTRDIDLKDLGDLEVPEGIKRLGSVESTHIELRGLCARCLRQNRDK
jgi:Fur family peroxide stress response transcriptional regulator